MGRINPGRFSLEERLAIEGLLRQNWTPTEIARFLSRTRDHVILEIQSNGGRYHYNHKKAHLNEDTAKNGGIDNKIVEDLFRNSNPQKPSSNFAEAKITAIEESIQLINEQISILFDTIKELKK